MKASLYVLGVYRGEIEVGDNSLVGLLARGMFGEGMAKAVEMQEELDAICDECRSDGEEKEEDAK